MPKIQRALTLFLREAERLEHLHLRFLTPMQSQTITRQLVCFQSSSMKFLEIEALNRDRRVRDQVMSVRNNGQTWSHRCPALTQVKCTDTRLLFARPRNMTYLCIKGVPGQGRGNVVYSYLLQDFLRTTKALAVLVIDGMYLEPFDTFLSIPHLHTLSIRTSLPPHGMVPAAAHGLPDFLLKLNSPALASLTIYNKSGEHISASLLSRNLRIPSITRFAVVPGSSSTFLYWPTALPGVEELVLLGSDPELHSITSISDDAWPNLRTIDLTELKPPPRQCLKELSDTLCQYGHRRSQSGHRSRVMVRLPRGIISRDLPLEVGEIMDLCTA